MRKLDVADLMEQMGLTDKVLMQSIAAGIVKPTKLIQKKQIDYTEITPPKVGQVVGNNLNGSEIRRVTETIYEEVPDNGVRYKFIELALKIKKRLSGEGAAGKVQQNNFSTENMTVQITNFGENQQIVQKAKTVTEPVVEEVKEAEG